MDKEEKLKTLSEEEIKVTQHGGTETPFQNEYWDHHEKGTYNCKVCGTPLFSSDTKLNSNEGPIGLRGWPAFDQALPGTVTYKEDTSMGMSRVEAVCTHCGAHLGHIFDDNTKTGKHLCMNSCSLDFKKGE